MTFQKTLSVLATIGVAATTSVSSLQAQAIKAPLLVAGAGSGNILRYDGETGAFIDAFVGPGVGGLCQGPHIGPHGLVFGPDGNLYVTCHYEDIPDFGVVLRYDGRSGEPLPGPFGAPGTAEFVHDDSGMLIRPLGLTFGPDGNLYVCSGGDGNIPSPGDADRVLRYDGQTGAFMDEFVITSSGGLDGPYDAIFGPDGHLYVTSIHTDQVLRYDGTTGDFIDVFASGDPLGVPMNEPIELRFGPDGNLYVTSWMSQNVARFDGQTGDPIDNFVPGGIGGSLSRPTGLRFGPDDGNLYVASHGTDRVTRYDVQTGALIDAFVTAGSGGLVAPVGLAFFPTPPCEGGGGQDCNHNGIDDTCEILEATSQDCNSTAVPDECEMAACAGDPGCDDCNANGTLDSCDIAAGAPDANANGIPDVCEYAAPEAPVATGEAARTNRYLRFSAPPPAIAGVVEEVVRVRIVNLDGYPTPTADVLYLGPPFTAPEEDSTQPGMTFAAAPLQCDPYAHAWSAEGVISAYGAELMPGSVYDVQRAGASCADLLTNEACWSAPLTITTAKYGDVWPVYDWENISPQPDFNDIAAVVQKFLAAGPASAPIKAVAQLQPNCVFPDRAIDFRDIAAAVEAFLGTPYASTHYGPCTCPSAVTCGASACTSDLQCGDGLCVNDFCTDPCGRCTP